MLACTVWNPKEVFSQSAYIKNAGFFDSSEGVTTPQPTGFSGFVSYMAFSPVPLCDAESLGLHSSGMSLLSSTSAPSCSAPQGACTCPHPCSPQSCSGNTRGGSAPCMLFRALTLGSGHSRWAEASTHRGTHLGTCCPPEGTGVAPLLASSGYLVCLPGGPREQWMSLTDVRSVGSQHGLPISDNQDPCSTAAICGHRSHVIGPGCEHFLFP